MPITDIQCTICSQIGYYVYTTAYLNIPNVKGYTCSNCNAYFTEEQFVEMNPDYDQSADHE